MSRESKLAKNTVIYFIGSFGSKMLSFLLLPVYSNYLTQEAYGNYDLIHTIIQIAYPAITLMLDNAMYVYLIGTNNFDRKNKIISFSVKTLVRNSCIAMIVCLFINHLQPVKYMFWVILWLLTFSAYNMWIQICRGYNQQKLYSLAGIVVTAVTLVGNIAGLVILKQDYRFLMVSNCLAYLIAVLLIEHRLHPLRVIQKGYPDRALKKELLKYSIPMLPNQLSWWILNVSDRLMIVYYLGTGANGVYAMACKIPAILNVVHSVFSAAWSDDILTSADMRETEKYAEKIYNIYIRVMIGISIILIASNRFVFEYIISGNFVEAYKYTYFLYVGSIFSAIGSCLGAFYGYYKKSLNVSLSTIAAATVNFLINLVFLSKFGIQVASISTCAGSIVIWIIRLLGLRGMVTVRISGINKLMFLILVPFYFTSYIDGLWRNILLIMAAVCIAILINFRTIHEVEKKFFNKILNKKESRDA